MIGWLRIAIGILATAFVAQIGFAQIGPGPLLAPVVISSAAGNKIAAPTSCGSLDSGGSASFTFTTNAAITAGRLLIVEAIIVDGGTVVDPTTATTVGVDTLTKAVGLGSHTGLGGTIWYKENASAQSSGVTVTVTPTSFQQGAVLQCAQMSGVLTASSLDKTNTGFSASATSVSITSGTLTQANEIVIGATGHKNNAHTNSGSTGFTTLATAGGASSATSLSFDYDIVSSTGSVTYNDTWSAAAIHGTLLATFKSQ